jgi:hypothetical protein
LANRSPGELALIPSSDIRAFRSATLSSISTLICFSSWAARLFSFWLRSYDKYFYVITSAKAEATTIRNHTQMIESSWRVSETSRMCHMLWTALKM